MNQNERDALVDRYLSGHMSGGEESDFFLKVAVDPELQRTLRAFKIVDRVVERDRETVPLHGRYRDHVMSLLAATHLVAGGGAAATGIAQAQVGASVGATSAGLPGGVMAAGVIGLKGIVAAIIGVGVVGGTLMIVLPSHDPVHPTGSDAVQQRSIIQDVPVQPAAPMPKPSPVEEAIAPISSTGSIDAASTKALSVPGGDGIGQRAKGRVARTAPHRSVTPDRSATYRRNPMTVLPDQTVVRDRSAVELGGPRTDSE